MGLHFQKFTGWRQKINWTLLIFLVLLLNVKLVIKLAAFLIIIFSQYRRVSLKEIAKQKHLYFYIGVISIAIINYMILPKTGGLNQVIAVGFGIALWCICIAASYYLFRIVQQDEAERLHNTIALFFILHIIMIVVNLTGIMIECGSVNPYTYKGLNQKYYISTGDFISGITFDSPVTTAMISAFSVLYFTYRRQFLLSLAGMVSLLIIASNLTNIFLAIILLYIFAFRTDRLQKSVILVQLFLLVVFTAKVSPQNNEYMGRFTYKMLGLTYDLPKKLETPELLKKTPDSLLTAENVRKKMAFLYIDSMSAVKATTATTTPFPTKISIVPMPGLQTTDSFYQFREEANVVAKKGKYNNFLSTYYTDTERDSLQKLYDWNKPGKWIAAKQISRYFKKHPTKLLTGAGTGNFSSRVALKTTSLGIAGNYPVKYSYIHPWFLNNHLFLYTYYHSQPQSKHAAENTPDSTYGQILSEYGIAGILVFLFFYFRFFLKRFRKLTYGLPVLIMILFAFFVEYWFEQLSIVILFELLLFVDMKSICQKTMRLEAQAT